MKKDRNCNAGMPPYPIYPAYNPGMGMQMMGNPNMMMQPNIGTPNMMDNNYQAPSSSLEQQVYNLNNQINSLERRVSNLENLVGNNNTTQYNTSNYQVM